MDFGQLTNPSAPGSKSEYAKKLREKQIIKRIYKVSEKIIKKYVNIAKNKWIYLKIGLLCMFCDVQKNVILFMIFILLNNLFM